MKANSKKPSNKKTAQKNAAKKKDYTLKMKKCLARHEAAHFVMSWAIGCQASYVDVTPAAQGPSKNPNTKTLAYTSRVYEYGGYDGYGIDDSFNTIIRFLAGPVADNWGKDGVDVLVREKAMFDDALDSVVGNYEDDGDWYVTLEELNEMGIDIKNPTKLKNAVLFFIKAVQEILKLCDKQWQELTEHLIKHGRIDLDKHWTESGNDWRFVAYWDDEDGLPPKVVRDCINKYRLLAPTGDKQ